MAEEEEKKNMTLKELRAKYIGKRFCIIAGPDRATIGKCKWIEAQEILGHKFLNWRIEENGRSYWATTRQIVRIKDEPDEVPYYSGW